ncbi:MAG: VOC family protein [Phenylobacterium sp.]|uniref:VOC family protein n=1 Tax=Phenylobacterium sp. TaxID=1871053 RepID=UPI00273582A9|nr:VOC family protein [Phenylobacterium sp.]MDP3172992.1 VOC family protein [Phenylobacterium sp.]
MAIVEKLGYVTLGVNDLDKATEFYTRVGRLAEVERTDRTVFLTAGRDHHWLRLEKADVEGVQRVGYDVGSHENLLKAIEVLKAWNIPYDDRVRPNEDRVEHSIVFNDPGGMNIDLFYGMQQLAAAPDNHGVNIKKILHAGWNSPNFEETVRFWIDGLGFKISDQIEDASYFMRCGDRFHHSLLLIAGKGDKPQFNHLAFLVDSIDDVMLVRNNGLRAGATLRSDVLKHTPSGSIAVYFRDAPRGFDFEYCFEHAQLDDDHVPRRLNMKEGISDIWQAELPDPVIA